MISFKKRMESCCEVGSEAWIVAAASEFEEQGVFVLPEKAVDDATVKRCLSSANFAEIELTAALENRRAALNGDDIHEAARCGRVDFAEMVARDGGRLDLRLRCSSPPLSDLSLVCHPLWFPLCKRLLGGGEVTLLYSGFMLAKSVCGGNGSEEGSGGLVGEDVDTRREARHQKWHQDGEHCFTHAHCPPHAINVFVPLVDVCRDNGATQFKLGSHLLGQGAEGTHDLTGGGSATGMGAISGTSPTSPSATPNTNTDPSSSSPFSTPTTPSVRAGGCVLFDYRTVHRGGANLVPDSSRVVMYFCYTKTWFADTRNTRSRVRLLPSEPPWVPRRIKHQQQRQQSLHRQLPPASTLTPTEASAAGNVGAAAGAGAAAASKMSDPAAASTCSDELDCSTGDHDAGAAYVASERWVLFELNVELGEQGEGGTLRVHHGDDPVEAATSFLAAHGVASDPGVVDPLVAVIVEQIRLSSTSAGFAGGTQPQAKPEETKEVGEGGAAAGGGQDNGDGGGASGSDFQVEYGDDDDDEDGEESAYQDAGVVGAAAVSQSDPDDVHGSQNPTRPLTKKEKMTASQRKARIKKKQTETDSQRSARLFKARTSKKKSREIKEEKETHGQRAERLRVTAKQRAELRLKKKMKNCHSLLEGHPESQAAADKNQNAAIEEEGGDMSDESA